MANYLKLNKSYIGNDILSNPEFNMLGPDLITNGNFETDSNWSKDDGWQIYGGKAICDGTNGALLSQSNVVTAGKIYTITVTVTDYVSGNVDVSVGAGPRSRITANGTYTFTQTAEPYVSFYIVSSSFVGAVDSVIVQESGQVEYVENGAFYGVDTSTPTSVSTLPGWGTWASPVSNNVISDSGKNVLEIVTNSNNGGAHLSLQNIPDEIELNIKIESVTGDVGYLLLGGENISIPIESGSVDFTFIKKSNISYLYFGVDGIGTTKYYNISIQPTNVFAYNWSRPSGQAQNGVVFSNNNVTVTTVNGSSDNKAIETASIQTGREYEITYDVLDKSSDVQLEYYTGSGDYIPVKNLSIGVNKVRFIATGNTSFFVNATSTSGSTSDFITLDSVEVQEVKNQPKLIGVDNVSTVSAPTNSTVVINNGLTDGADTVTITYEEADATSTVQMRNFFQDAIVESANANNTGKVIEIKSPVLINDIVAS